MVRTFGGCDACKGVVTIDSHTGEVSRNDEYYAFAHFSRFVLPGAFRVGSTETDKGIDTVAFQNVSDGSIVLVMSKQQYERASRLRGAGPNRFPIHVATGERRDFRMEPGSGKSVGTTSSWLV